MCRLLLVLYAGSHIRRYGGFLVPQHTFFLTGSDALAELTPIFAIDNLFSRHNKICIHG
jgi:hypothetical protein